MRVGNVSVGLVLMLALGVAGCGDQGATTPSEPPQPARAAPRVGVAEPVREGDPLAEVDAFIAEKKIDRTSAGWRTRLPVPIQVGFPKDQHVYWTLETNKGRIVAKLWHEVAPLHASQTIYLTRLGFYDGLTFHRVIRGFMAQGGCPLGNGRGMPGYSLPLEVRRDVKHDRIGILSTANMGPSNTDGTQFFIMFAANKDLDGKYSIFGEVVEGLDTVRAMEAVGATPRFQGDSDAPRERLFIESASVSVR